MYLLDTNVVSELRKASSGKANQRVVDWAEQVRASSLYLSVITVLELEIGTLQVERRDSAQGELLRTWMNKHVLPSFKNRIIPIDTAAALQCAQLHVPNPRSERDALIGATAIAHRMTVVTRNIRDFQHMDIALLNPWEA